MWKNSETAMYGFLLASLAGAAVAKVARVVAMSDVKYIIDEEVRRMTNQTGRDLVAVGGSYAK